MALLLLDACTLINLLATEQIDAIAKSGAHDFRVVEKVADEVFTLPDSNNPDIQRQIDVRNRNEIKVLSGITKEETELYVSLSATLDAGEAETLAVALNRGMNVATDDQAALRLLREEHPEVPVMRTSQLIRTWGEAGHQHEVAAVLHAIETRASFHVPRQDPEREWWLGAR